MSDQRSVLLVASTGGHLRQLHLLAPSLAPHSERVWVTFDTAQSRSLLLGEPIRFVPYIAPRDVRGVLRAFRRIVQILRAGQFSTVYSTGSGIALSAFAAALLTGKRRVYIESVSRIDGPSLTGRLVSRFRLAELRSQHDSPRYSGWGRQQSVLGAFEKVEKASPPIGDGFKLFVTLGTIKPYRFDALVDALLNTDFVNARTVWQLGSTSRSDLPGAVHAEMTREAMTEAARDADVVVTHAGVGSILDLLSAGVYPVVVARDPSRNEHIDDHQRQIADFCARASIAAVVDPASLNDDALLAASRYKVRQSHH